MEGLNMKRLISSIIAFCLILSSIAYAAPTGEQGDNENKNGTTVVMKAGSFDEFAAFSSQLISNDDSGSFSTGLTVKVGESIATEKSDGEISLSSVTPEVTEVDGVIMAPLSVIAKEANASAVYNADEKNITVEKENTQVVITPGEKTIQVDEKENEVSAAPYIDSGNTMVPVAEVAENIGFDIKQVDDDTLYLTRDYQTKRIIVKANEGKSIDDYYGAESALIGYDDIYILQYATEEEARNAVSKYLANPSVKYAEPDRVITLAEDVENENDSYIEADETSFSNEGLTSTEEVDSEPASHLSWGADAMNVDVFNEQLKENIGEENLPEVVVGVVDTGIDSAHPYLKDKIIPNDYNYVTKESSSEDKYGSYTGHGTHVSGTIIDLTLPNVKVMPFKVFSEDANGARTSSCYNGMIAAVNKKVDVINASFGGKGRDPYIEEAVLKAYNAGIPVIASAGNDSDDVDNYSPANIEKAITVSAIDKDYDYANFSWWGTNWGKTIDFAAPGVDIVSSIPEGEYGAKSGTSMAAPHVSAAAAMLKSYSKDFDVDRIENILDNSTTDLGTAGWDKYYGDGMVNLKEAWENLENIVPAPTFSYEDGNLSKSITLSCSDSDAEIYYTTDGSSPSKSSTRYNSPILIDKTVVINAVAYKNGKKSYIVEKSFYIGNYSPESDFEIDSYGVITKYKGSDENVNVPPIINGNKVTDIGEDAFYDNKTIKTVILPNGVTSIGYRAFRSCSSLTSITIPDSVTSIGSDAFSDCSSLTSITIPDSVTSIGSDAFSDCSSLTSITIPDSVTSIGSYVFSDCSSLTNVTIPESVTSIGSWAFKGCDSLTSITIPNSVTSIGSAAFSYCGSLTEITIPNSVTSIEDRTFHWCRSLTEITIPNSVTSIGSAAFSGCGSLTSIKVGENNKNYASMEGVLFNKTKTTLIAYPAGLSGTYTIPETVTSIERYAFYWCSRLTEIIIPESVNSIESYAFSSCSELNSAYFKGDAPTSFGTSAFVSCAYDFTIYCYEGTDWPDIVTDTDTGNTTWKGYDIKMIEKDSNIEYSPESDFEIDENGVITKYKGSNENVNVPPMINGKEVTGVGYRAFYENKTIKNVILPKGVTSIGRSAFYSCGRLTSITIPDNVTSIEDSAFHWCRRLTEITIPDSVTSIGSSAFYGCDSLTEITIPDSVTSIGNSAFSYCYSLTSIKVSENNKSYASINGVLFNKTKTTLIACPGGLKGTYTIQDNVTSIGADAFYGCRRLTSITIPDSVTSIGADAFSKCYSLTSIIIPDSVTSIGISAFYGCISLTSITIPDSVTSIEYSAFYGCDSLTSITIPDSVTRIKSYAFSSCNSLTSITIPDSVTSIEDHTFYDCSSLTEIIIPDSVTSIEYSAFYGCDSLTSITIPDSVTRIRDSFEGCSSLSSAYFKGNAPTDFGKSVFTNCASDFTIYCYEGTDWPDIQTDSDGNLTWKGYKIVKLNKIGDVDRNKEVDIFDVMQLLKYTNSLEELSEEVLKTADINGDGEVDVFDVMALLQRVTEFN